jgi:hypothetical protein
MNLQTLNSGEKREIRRKMIEEEKIFMEVLRKTTGCRVTRKGNPYNSIIIHCDRTISDKRKLSQWRKEIYGKVNLILLNHPMGKKLKMQKKVGTILSKGICQFCKINMNEIQCDCKSYRNEYSDDECYSNCHECPERRKKNKNERYSHKATYLKLYDTIEITNKSIRKFNPEQSKEFAQAKTLLMIHKRRPFIPRDILYILVNLILKPIRIRNGKPYYYRKIPIICSL